MVYGDYWYLLDCCFGWSNGCMDRSLGNQRGGVSDVWMDDQLDGWLSGVVRCSHGWRDGQMIRWIDE